MMVQLLIMGFVIFASRCSASGVGIGPRHQLRRLRLGDRPQRPDVGRPGSDGGRPRLGLNYFTTMRFIVIPQAVKNILPALGNEFITLLKDTSLITVIGGKEMTYAAKAVIAKTYQGLFPLFGIALMYLLLVHPVFQAARHS